MNSFLKNISICNTDICESIDDFTLFQKKYRGLKRCAYSSYKDLMFAMPKLYLNGEGEHIYEVPTDELFKNLYGQIKLIYKIVNNRLVVIDLLPSQVLVDCYMKDFDLYKGVPVRNKKDIQKLKILQAMKG